MVVLYSILTQVIFPCSVHIVTLLAEIGFCPQISKVNGLTPFLNGITSNKIHWVSIKYKNNLYYGL